MFDDMRRKVKSIREARERSQLEGMQLRRAQSELREKQQKQYRLVEEDLTYQTRSEIASIEAARRAQRERKLAQHELRSLHPSPLRRAARTVARIGRYRRPGTGKPKRRPSMRSFIVAPPGFFGPGVSKAPNPKTEEQSMSDFLYGGGGGIF